MEWTLVFHSFFLSSVVSNILFLSLCRLDQFCFVCWFGFLTSSSTTKLYCGRVPRQSIWQFYVLPHMRQSLETITSVPARHIILTPTQPVGSGRPQPESNAEPPHQESRALPTELLRAPSDEGDRRLVMSCHALRYYPVMEWTQVFHNFFLSSVVSNILFLSLCGIMV